MLSCNPLAACIAAMQARSNQAKESTEGTTMTTAIEVTKREMYEWLGSVKRLADSQASAQAGEMLELCLEAHLEALRQDRAALEQRCETQGQSIKTYQHNCMALTTERDTLRNRVQVLEMANATSGEVIRSLKREAEQARKALMVARLTEFAAQVSSEQENASCADTRGDTDDILELRSRMVADLIERHDARKAKSSEQKRAQEERVAAMNAEVMKVSMGMNRMLWSLWADAFPKEKCMHSFHPAFPSGELCTFCGVGK